MSPLKTLNEIKEIAAINSISRLQNDSAVLSVSFSPDGKYIVSTSNDNKIVLWNNKSIQQDILNSHQSYISQHINQAVEYTNLAVEYTNLSNSFSKSLEISSSNQIYETRINAESNKIITASERGFIKVWNISNNLRSEAPSLSKLWKVNYATDFSISDDGNFIVVGKRSGDIDIFEPDGKKEATISGDGTSISSVRFSPDSSMIATADTNGTVNLWNRDGTQISQLRQNLKDIEDIFISHDNQTIAIQELSGRIRLISSSDGQELITLGGSYRNQAKGFDFDALGRYAVLYKERVDLVDKNNQVLNTFKCENSSPSSIDIRNDGKAIALGCRDGTVQIHDTRSKLIVKKLDGHNAAITKLQFSLGGNFLISTSSDGITKLWELAPTILTTCIVILLTGSFSIIIIIVFRRTKCPETKKYYMAGVWKFFLPEEWRGDLESLRHELLVHKKRSEFYMQLITTITLIDMLWGGIRVKIEDFFDPNIMISASGKFFSDLDNSEDSVN